MARALQLLPRRRPRLTRASRNTAQGDAEATLQRINAHKGVHATILLNREGEAVRSNAEPSVTSVYAELIPQLATLARSLVRDLDPQNDLQFLRIRSKEHEIMVYADPAFTLIVIQDPSVGTASDPSDAEGAAQRHEPAGVKPPRLGA